MHIAHKIEINFQLTQKHWHSLHHALPVMSETCMRAYVSVLCPSLWRHLGVRSRGLIFHPDSFWLWEGAASLSRLLPGRDLQGGGHLIRRQAGKLAGHPLGQRQPAAWEGHHSKQEQVRTEKGGHFLLEIKRYMVFKPLSRKRRKHQIEYEFVFILESKRTLLLPLLYNALSLSLHNPAAA